MKLTRKCWKYIDNYLGNSSLHGLRYVRDPTISYGERFFWLTTFIGALMYTGYSISLIYISQKPIVVYENSEPTFVSDIPFPTITICNMNKVRRSEANKIMRNGTDTFKKALKEVCNYGTNSTISWRNLRDFYINVRLFKYNSHMCSDLVKDCMFRSTKIDCNRWFNPTFTSEGVCCTFNLIPSNIIFKNEANYQELKYNYPIMVENWNPERGFDKDPVFESVPWRVEGGCDILILKFYERILGSGEYFGLTLVLDANLDEYYCSSTESTGFKMTLYNPIENMGYPRFIPLHRECYFQFITTVKDAEEDVRSVDIKNRRCYFNHEKYLRYFRVYTKRNCEVECAVNETIQKCKCAPFYLPSTYNLYFIVNASTCKHSRGCQ
ncbi:hypothetical protein FQA39_LY05328 [Lamprigera yunnana]|nr:hypothetical protein FQA39_LY05328 [Lamprigera yunnana]